jgi:DNA-binding HxlR family transcriptional regulator
LADYSAATSPCVMDENCALRRTFDLIADRWTPTVLFTLSFGPKRYSELQKAIPDISKKMLTQTLREGGRNGLVERAGDAARGEYRLTELGRKVLEPVLRLADWAQANEAVLGEVAARRRAALRAEKGGG